MVVQQLHAGTHARLIVALGIAAHVPSFGFSLGQKKLYLGIAHQVARRVRHLKVDVQLRTHGASTEVGVVVSVSIHVGLLLQRRQLRGGRNVHPVAIPCGTRVTGLFARLGSFKVGQHLVGKVNVFFLIRLYLATLYVVIVAADAIEARVGRALQLIEQGRTYEGGRGGILTIQYLAQRVGAEVVVVSAIIVSVGRVGILNVNIVCRAADGPCCHCLLKLILCFLWVYVGYTHGVTHTQRIGIFLPLCHVATHAGNVARNVVGACTQERFASCQLFKEPVVQFFYSVILGC